MPDSFPQNVQSRAKRLAFVGAGFADIEEEGKWNRKPFRIVISNFFRKGDEAWTAVPYKHFRVHFHWLLEDRDFELFVAGQPLDKDREAQLNRILERCMRNKVKPEMIGRLFTREIQKAAAVYKTIGKNIMCVMVPRQSGDYTNTLTYRFGAVELKRPVISAEPQHLEPVEVISDQYRFAIPPPFDAPVFVYVAGDSKALPYYGPVLVGPQCIVPPVIMHEMNIIVPPVSPAHGPQEDTTLYKGGYSNRGLVDDESNWT
jgi:hypothetical protein